MPNWIVKLELEWPALPGEQDAERAFNRLRPGLEALRVTMSVMHDSPPHWHRLTTPRLEGEAAQETLDPVADELLRSPVPPR